ncbi:uncharacterized protein [Mytilus edulis]|uniref:uncharacterized protein n=1 Tax=Mytilus edulis TaxID=6550 RepID=UPI0039F0D547
MQTISSRTYNRLQTLYISPSASMAWDAEQTALLTDLYDKEVIVGGDTRCDSPGYSAKYGSYTMMDLESSKILDFQLVQCNEVKGSAHMELEGLKRSIRYLENMMHIKIKDLVTDRHSSIKKFMRTEQDRTNHLFDVWHVAKGISKKLEAAAKKSGSKDIRPWIKSIVNHIYWISSSSGTNGDLKLAKWRSIVNHISSKHEHTLSKICGSVPYKRLKDIVESRYLMVDVPKLSPVYQTYSLEVFHSLVNHFCPKSTHFFYPTMLARLSIAALHYNDNSGRHQATTKTGEQLYVTLIKQAVVERRREEDTSYTSASDDVSVYNNHHPDHMTSTFNPFRKNDLIQRHRSRFQRQ